MLRWVPGMRMHSWDTTRVQEVQTSGFFHTTTAHATIFHINGGASATIYGNTWTAVTGNWYQIGLSRIGNQWTFYRNGRPDGVAIDSTPTQSAITPLTLGTAETGTGFLNGVYDDVRIYNRGLSDSEFAAAYRNASTGYPSILNRIRPLSLIARLPVTYSFGVTATDSVGATATKTFSLTVG